MNFQEIHHAWKTSALEPSTWHSLSLKTKGSPTMARRFYGSFEQATGIPEAVVRKLFAEWNKLTSEEAERIAQKHGTNLQEGGFHAYLAEMWEEVSDGDRATNA